MTSYKHKSQILVKAANHILRNRSFYKKATNLPRIHMPATPAVSGQLPMLNLFRTGAKTGPALKAVGSSALSNTASNAVDYNKNNQNSYITTNYTYNPTLDYTADTISTLDLGNAAAHYIPRLSKAAPVVGNALTGAAGAVQAAQGGLGLINDVNDIYNGDQSFEKFTDTADNTALTASGAAATLAALYGSGGTAVPLLAMPWWTSAKNRAVKTVNNRQTKNPSQITQNPLTEVVTPMDISMVVPVPWKGIKAYQAYQALTGNNKKQTYYNPKTGLNEFTPLDQLHEIDSTMGQYIAQTAKNMVDDTANLWNTVTGFNNDVNSSISENRNQRKKMIEGIKQIHIAKRAKDLIPLWDSLPDNIREDYFKNENPGTLDFLRTRQQKLDATYSTGNNPQAASWGAEKLSPQSGAYDLVNDFMGTPLTGTEEPRPLEIDSDDNVVSVGKPQLTPYGNLVNNQARARKAQKTTEQVQNNMQYDEMRYKNQLRMQDPITYYLTYTNETPPPNLQPIIQQIQQNPQSQKLVQQQYNQQQQRLQQQALYPTSRFQQQQQRYIPPIRTTQMISPRY